MEKCVPVMVTLVPTGPTFGLNPVIVVVDGVAGNRKLPLLVTVPFGLVTLIGPVVAPAGTPTLSEVAVATPIVAVINVEPDVKLTVLLAIVGLKFVPVIVTFAPTGPIVGVNPVMVGAGGAVVTEKLAPVAVPLGLETWIVPEFAPAGTVTVSDVLVAAVIVAPTVPILPA